ncbi:hypothetical protein C1H46_016837 [Malus baccata]|uniref:Malectin-like domain-containing protein n=1 Tax=Malus baccata TaxID=106549 RepID=A0A540MFQ3_MALBA|nr:hypothetical protein C1H46_016837 [Malus baccata]
MPLPPPPPPPLPLPLPLPPLPKGTLINCGAAVKSEIDGREWLPDTDFVSDGTSLNLTTPGLVPILSTARLFSNYPHRKFCYTVQVYRNTKYMVRTTYYYNNSNSPLIFDQIMDDTFWVVVNTTENYSNNMSSYYEGVFLAQAKTMNVCLGYPDDQFDRFWAPFEEHNPLIPINVSNSNASVSGIWNMPHSKVFKSELTTGQAEAMELDWPPGSVPESNYYIALYFASGDSSGSRWPLSGSTRITMTIFGRLSGGAQINAGELFDVLPLGGTTLTRDVIALQRVKQSLQNPPPNWSGDPRLPHQYSWTGITCSPGPRVRMVSLNLTSMGISGSLSPSIANMTALYNM